MPCWPCALAERASSTCDDLRRCSYQPLVHLAGMVQVRVEQQMRALEAREAELRTVEVRSC